jgi:hypothetical protein
MQMAGVYGYQPSPYGYAYTAQNPWAAYDPNQPAPGQGYYYNYPGLK